MNEALITVRHSTVRVHYLRARFEAPGCSRDSVSFSVLNDLLHKRPWRTLGVVHLLKKYASDNKASEK